MSTPDSDHSEWQAGEEEDSDGVIAPQHGDTRPPPSSTTTTTTASLTEYPRNNSGTVTTTTPLSKNTDSTLRDACTDRPKRKRGDRTEDTSHAKGYTCMGHDDIASLPFWNTAPPGVVTGRPCQTQRRSHSQDFGGACRKPESKDTENMFFSHKCVELQRYIQPLASILQGLSSGRYSQRLSSFQESVAMDRIQRILGVLQNPNMGERFLGTLLQIEKMLHSWFPRVLPRPTVIQSDHSSPAKRQKRDPSSTIPSSSLPSLSTHPASTASRGPHSTTSLKWLHTSPICCPKTAGPRQPASTTSCSAPSGTRTLGATQDSAVSSSTDGVRGGRVCLRPAAAAPFKLRSPCLERLLQAKDSMVSRRTAQEGEEHWGQPEPRAARLGACAEAELVSRH